MASICCLVGIPAVDRFPVGLANVLDACDGDAFCWIGPAIVLLLKFTSSSLDRNRLRIGRLLSERQIADLAKEGF